MFDSWKQDWSGARSITNTCCDFVIFREEKIFSNSRKVRSGSKMKIHKAPKIGKGCLKVNAWAAITRTVSIELFSNNMDSNFYFQTFEKQHQTF